jgi:PAS domain S-box-containing protein
MDTILLVVSNNKDRELLAKLLSSKYTIIESNSINDTEHVFDLCLIDTVSLEKEWNNIMLIRRNAEPIYLPVLLLTLQKDVGLSTRNLWKIIDDIILIPIEKIELNARIKNLLLTRKLSVELKRRDDAIIEENQTRLALAIRSSKIGFLDWELEDNKIWLSPELKTQLGYDHSEMENDYTVWIEHIHPEDNGPFFKIIEENIASHNSYFETEIRLLNKSLDYLYFLVHIAIFYKNNSAYRILLSNIDVTERKKDQIEKENLLELNKAMFNGHDAIMLLVESLDGRVLDANPAAAKFYGYTREELLALNIRDINPILEDLEPKTIPLIMNRKQQQFTFTHNLKNGEKRIVDIYPCPINYHGQTKYFSIIFDVTEREKLRNDLYLEKEYLKNLIEYANAPIITWTPELTINEFNSAFERLTGLSRKEVIGQQIDILFPSKENNLIKEKIENTSANEHWDNIEIPVQTTSGEIKTVLWNSAHVYGSDGIEIATIAQGMDITERNKSEQKLLMAMKKTVELISKTVELRDPYTAGHQDRVMQLSDAIAKKIGIPEEEIVGINMAAIVHDLGKMYVPSEILSKPGKLSTIEYELIKTHAQAGYEILKNVEFPWPLANMILQHHERMDGTGYPNALMGTSILLGARILAVADVVEAMVSHRPYRPALGIDMALQEIFKNKGTKYDEQIVDACLNIFQQGFLFE